MIPRSARWRVRGDMTNERAQVKLRRAAPADCARLTAVALRSKAHWGYDDAFMEACVAELAVTPQTLDAGEIWLAETGDGVIAGFADVRPEGAIAEVYAVFVDPPFMAKGIGLALWDKIEEAARRFGSARIGVDSDPNAEGYYVRMGCVAAGTAPSGSIPGRMLPRLEKSLPRSTAR